MSRKLFIPPTLLFALALASCQSAFVAASVTPGPQAAEMESSYATEAPSSTEALTAYTWRGAALTLAVPLPEGPSQANIYLGHPDSPATIESARALAQQFGMQGDIYDAPSGGYLIVDGNRRLQVQSDYRFTYYPSHFNYAVSNVANHSPENAANLIAGFLTQFGFDADYKLTRSGYYAEYIAQPLSPDGFPLHFSHFALSGFWFDFNEDGIVSVSANLLDYDPISSFGIISAEEAFQKLLDPAPQYGTLEGFHSPTNSYPAWMRHYPFDETVTLYVWMSSIPSAEGGDALISLDGYAVTGNIDNIPANLPDTFVQATGKFHTENGIDFFVLDSWQPHTPGEGWLGTLQREGDGVVLITNEGVTLHMPDVPADVPLPLEDVYAMGVTVGDTFEWNAFDLRMAGGGGGGGGGGGLGFYGLNLSGTPMPLPTLASPQQLQPKIGENLEGLRGFASVTLFDQPDGGQRAEYYLFYVPEGQPFSTALLLQGEGLDELQDYHNLPVEIWGTVIGLNEQNGMAVVNVDRFVVPFPNLDFQILSGTQSSIKVEGLNAVLFTTAEGQSYVQLMPAGGLDATILGYEGDEVLLEAVVVPDEAFGGYATLHVFAGSVATSPKDGQQMELTITADQPYVQDEPEPQVQEIYEPPVVSVDSVELVYLAPYLVHSLPDTDFYIQPMWRFAGHYSSGDEFEVFIQALKPEFLSPEIVTVEPPG